MRLIRIALSALTAALVTTTPVLARSITLAWEVTDQRQLHIDGTPIALSPDGAWIAGLDPDKETFCVWDVKTLKPTCDGEVDAVVPASVTWAPDSTAVAFSLNAPQWFVDSDIFVFDVASGTLHNLTEDGDTELGLLGSTKVPVNVDLYPSWSPDSEQLVFGRTVSVDTIENPNTVLMTIPREGGEPTELLTLAPPYPMSISSTMAWREDDTILFSVWKAKPTDTQNGIWRTSPDGGIHKVLPGTGEDDVPMPVIADVSSDGSQLSVISLGNFSLESGDVFWLTNTNDPMPVPVREATSQEDGSRMLSAPAFAPDGEHIAYLTSKDDAISLTIASTVSGKATSVVGLESSLPSDMQLRSVDWTENGMIFIGSIDGGTLLTLDAD